MSEVTVMPTQYLVTMLPVDDEEATIWALNVEWCGIPYNAATDHPEDRVWAVRRIGRCLSRTGRWVWEPIPSSRTPTFYKRHRFTFEEAVAAAKRELPKLRINGLTSEDLLARR
jgi:hypothetical protein